MCTPSPPKQTVTAPPPPAEAPKPLATPEGPLAGLKIGTKTNLKVKPAAPASGLTIPSQP